MCPLAADSSCGDGNSSNSNDKDLRLNLGRGAHIRCEEFYLWDKLGDRLQEIYQSALKENEASDLSHFRGNN